MDSSLKPSIYSSANRCLDSFEKLILDLEEGPICSDFSLQAAKDERARFRVWADNIGALVDSRSRSSADARLEEAPQIQGSAVRMLGSLDSSLIQASQIASGSRENRIAPDLQEELNVEMSSDESSSSSSVGEMEISQQTKHSTTEQIELYEAVKSEITSLFKLSVIIRNPVPRGKYRDSADLLPIDPSFDIDGVWEKFPAIRRKLWLAERLGRAITRRREYMRYRQEHNRKLASGKGSGEWKEEPDEGREVASTKPTSFAADQDRDFQHGSDFRDEEIFDRVSEASDTSFAISKSADTGVQKLRVPSPPDVCPNDMTFEFGKHFECPYCYTIQIVENYQDWKRHVFRDLQPYVCTFENCSAKLFSRRHDWFDHELEMHRREYSCLECGQGPWQTQTEIEVHLKQKHPGSWSEAQIAPIIRNCSTAVQDFSAVSCPLCDDWKSTRAQTLGTGNVGKATKERYRRHLAGHLEQLALSALPMAETSNELGDEPSDEPGREPRGASPSPSRHVTPSTGDWSLRDLAKDAEDVASGLQIYVDEIPSYDRDFLAHISALFAISAELRRLDQIISYSSARRAAVRLIHELDLLCRSLELTLDTVKLDFFGVQHSAYSRRAWDNLSHQFEREGRTFGGRLVAYQDLAVGLGDIMQGDRELDDIEPTVLIVKRLKARQLPPGMSGGTVQRTFHGWSFRKIFEAGVEPSWSRCRQSPLPYSNEELARVVKKSVSSSASGRGRGGAQGATVADQYQALRSAHLRAAVDRLLLQQKAEERSPAVEWVLACIETDVHEVARKGVGRVREIKELRVILKRQPKPGQGRPVATGSMPGDIIDFENPLMMTEDHMGITPLHRGDEGGEGNAALGGMPGGPGMGGGYGMGGGHGMGGQGHGNPPPPPPPPPIVVGGFREMDDFGVQGQGKPGKPRKQKPMVEVLDDMGGPYGKPPKAGKIDQGGLKMPQTLPYVGFPLHSKDKSSKSPKAEKGITRQLSIDNINIINPTPDQRDKKAHRPHREHSDFYPSSSDDDLRYGGSGGSRTSADVPGVPGGAGDTGEFGGPGSQGQAELSGEDF